MSCFGCFGGAKDDRAGVTHPAPQPPLPITQHQQASTANTSSDVKATPAVPLPSPAAASPAPIYEAPALPVVFPAPGPPWRSREELADIAQRIAGASGPWLERAHTCATVLAESLGATLLSIWAFSSDKSTAVVVASGGILRKLQPQGHSITLESTEGAAETSLQRVISCKAPLLWSTDSSTSSDGPHDWQQMAASTGMQHCAMLPLKYGGVMAGALQIVLGGSQSLQPGGADKETSATAAWPAGASSAPPADSAAAKPNLTPNWLPHHLPELMLLSPVTAVGGAACGISSHVSAGSDGSQAKPVPQAVVDLVAALRRCDTIRKLIGAMITGLQDLTYRVTAMPFSATPMLVHRSAVTAAIFQDSAIKEGGAGNTRSEADREMRAWPTSKHESQEASEPPRSLKAHITHLNHTLMLQLITGADNNRYRRQYGGSIIQNCSDYMQDEGNRGRDVSLCHRVGVVDAGSLVLATGVLPGGVPLLCAYLTCREPLPEPMLESALAVVHQALKLSLLAVQALLQQGALSDEWCTLHDVHLNPSSVAVSTSCTPRSIVRTAIKEVPLSPGQHATLPAVMPNGVTQEEGLIGQSVTGGRRNLSFGITTSSAAAPRSNLGMMVSSIRSSLNQVLSQRAALEAEGLRDDVNGVELIKQIGQGGQGVVFCGTLHGLEVAIKVVGTEEGADEVYDIDDEGAMIKLKRVLKRDATELAVTTSISHPNIVQVFSYFVDVMVVEYVGQPDRFKLLPKAKGQSANGAEPGGVTGPSNMIICMEYCDAGSLKQAVKKGCFRTEVAVARPNMQALYTTLMEIALALRHLHALRLVHCDLKPSNILLKSSMRDHRGWVCKLSDFGCVRLMSEPAPGQRATFNLEYAVGTPSFMAPEMFCKGHPLDAAVDIYSFGILMWEVYTGGTVYDGVPPDKLPYHVVKRGLRPPFPPDSPTAFRSLAQACWASDPRSRPTAAALVTVLQRLLSSCVTAPPVAGGPAPPGHGA